MEEEFWLGECEGKYTRREQLTDEWNATGREPEELAGHDIEPPWCVRYLWKWWQELARKRPSQMGEGPITFDAMGWWAWLTQRRPERWEIEALSRIDELYLAMKARQADGNRKPAAQPAGAAERR